MKGMQDQPAEIGKHFHEQPIWKILLGVPLIYLPIIVAIPFMLLGVTLVRIHLRFIGGHKLKSYWDFVPHWATHRYNYQTQITDTSTSPFAFGHYKFFWIFNCKIYCPLSVALTRYAAYLVMIVENWWCPFNHEKKPLYSQALIDESYWHISPTRMAALHADDRENPIWHHPKT